MKKKIEDNGICLECGHEEKEIGLSIPDDLKWDLEFENNTDLRQVVNYRKIIDIYESQIRIIQELCKHQSYESRFHNKGRILIAGGIMNCPKCDLSIDGWYCPKSKTHQCEYNEHDQCKHCDFPSERK